MTAADNRIIQEYHDRQIMRPGDIVWTWCSQHMDRTNHLWTGKKLICLECEPEANKKPPKADEDK